MEVNSKTTVYLDDDTEIYVNVSGDYHPHCEATRLDPSAPESMEVTSITDMNGNDIEVNELQLEHVTESLYRAKEISEERGW